eukprot:scaffold148342_cov36-Cyclotella_meneghiniana.AAC.1
MANHIHSSFNNLGHHDREGDVDMGDSDDPDELDWKWVDVDFLDEPITTATTTEPAVHDAFISQNRRRRAGLSCDVESSYSRSR